MSVSIRKSFTLIEMLVVVAIIAAIALIVLPQLNDMTAIAEKAAADYNDKVVFQQLQNFKAKHGVYPCTFHNGFADATGTAPAADLPDAIRINFDVNSQEYQDGLATLGKCVYIPNGEKNLFDALAKANRADSMANSDAYTKKDWSICPGRNCSNSLVRAGLHHLYCGNVDETANFADATRYVPYPLLLTGALQDGSRTARSYSFCVGDAMSPENEIKVNGYTIREWYGKPYGSFECVSCIIPVLMADNFSFTALSANGTNLASGIGLETKPNPSQPYRYVAFFVSDRVKELGGRTMETQRPAELLAVVSVDRLISDYNKKLSN